MPTELQNSFSQRPACTPQRSLDDRFGRTMKKLRVSLTDRCNYRCAYCMPECPTWGSKDQILSLEELRQLVGVFVTRFGIEQLRLTGGEPLLRRGASRLVAALGELRAAGLRRISLSTNGALLARYARDLADSGLDDVNVSLDSLSPERFHAITGGGNVHDVFRGIDAARQAGLPVKINAVVMRGSNDAEVLPLATWAYRSKLPLRFIEFMPLDSRGLWSPDKVFAEREMIAVLSREFEVTALPRTSEPAAYYLLNGSFRLGVISTVSNPFCARCDRIRLTADGRLFGCLFSPTGVDLKGALRANCEPALLEERIAAAVSNKPRGFVEASAAMNRHPGMHVLGG
jgi:cyclic pyranopterin phosphate synthase